MTMRADSNVALCSSLFTLYVSDILPFSFDLSGTDSALYPYDPEQGYFKNFWFPTTNVYPYFLFPPTTRPRMPAPHGTAHTVGTLTYRTHRTGTAIVNDNQVNVERTFNDTIKYPGFSIPSFTDQGEPLQYVLRPVVSFLSPADRSWRAGRDAAANCQHMLPHSLRTSSIIDTDSFCFVLLLFCVCGWSTWKSQL